ncbi:MAG: hypothetical protein L0Y66_08900 [Myxococcaceae bacterium]|nr:hypothetical protein [Myxococcaceae bacterium]MCI0673688.1 hypothetical protein [Myxococcaceae bacterium]
MTSHRDGLMPVGRDRVREHSSSIVNERIDQSTRAQLQQYVGRDAEAIGWREAQLEREWDIDRALMGTFAAVVGLTASLALRGTLREGRPSAWLIPFGAQLGFLMLHAVVGWCPPVALFRRLGFRTQKEIDAERFALHEALRARGHAAPAR